jgi:radical SAM protein with 4Fe4S-binding SPASM domain
MIWLELTSKCNLRCLHCYAESGPEASYKDSLVPEKWKEIIRDAAEIGFSKIQFTGGEPLLYPDLISLIRTARESDYEFIEVYSNLTLLSDKLVDEFKSSGVCAATSFYSYDRQTHNRTTQSKSSYDRTLNGIKKLINAEIPLRIGVILMEHNLSHREKTGEFLKELGVPKDKIGFDYVRCSGRGADMPQMKNNTPPRKLRKNHRGAIVWNNCWAGKVAVKSDGTVSPCVFARRATDTVKGKRLREVVSGRKLRSYWEVTLGEVEVCRDCEFRYGCFDCRANVLNYTGDLYAKNPLCGYNPYTGIWEGNVEQYGNVKPKRKLDVQWERFDEQVILYDSTRNFSLLNSTGVMIWELCDGEHSIQDITDEFLSAYEAEPECVCADVKRMVGEFAMRGLLESQVPTIGVQ